MFSKVSLAVLSCAVAAQATHVQHEMDLFHPMNFVKTTTPMNLLRSVVDDVQHKLKDGHVVFTPCDA